MSGPRILVVDNYDSFVFNLVQYLAQLGADVTVVRNDAVTPADCPVLRRSAVVPGTGNPGRCRSVHSDCARVRREDPDIRCVPRTSSDRRGVRGDGPPGTGASARKNLAGGARRSRSARRTTEPVHRHSVSLTGRGPRHHSRPSGSHRSNRIRCDHGAEAPRRHGGGGAVSPRVGVDRGWPRDVGELVGRLWIPHSGGSERGRCNR